jgi:aminoglycoside/choline kinase family phosphotransferase
MPETVKVVDSRRRALCEWVRRVSGAPASPFEAVSSDASFRRYFRFKAASGESLLAMDAPPEREKVSEYVKVAGLLAGAGLNAPRVLAADIENGFVLISDLGARTWLDVIDESNADALFGAAIDALVRFQCSTTADALPPYDAATLGRELDLFPAWYLAEYRGVVLSGAHERDWKNVRGALIDSAVAQPRVFVHRDFMPRNLMVSEPNPGIIDFQDAVLGPVTYDAVSLFKDAFVSWPEARVKSWRKQYWLAAREARVPVQGDYAEFERAFDWMGVQRHLKILGLFARLHYRDGKPRYLAETPRFVDYIRTIAAREATLDPLISLLNAS